MGVTASHRKPERDRERASVTEKRLASHFGIPKHCFVAKQLNKTLFCRDASKKRYFLSKIVKIRAMSQKNCCKCDESRLHTLSHSGANIDLISNTDLHELQLLRQTRQLSVGWSRESG